MFYTAFDRILFDNVIFKAILDCAQVCCMHLLRSSAVLIST